MEWSKRAVATAAILSLVMGIAAGVAAALIGDDWTLIASDDDLVCDTTGVYVSDWDWEIVDGRINGLTISGIDAACQGLEIAASVDDAVGETIAVTEPSVVVADSVTLEFTPVRPRIEEVERLNIFLVGPGVPPVDPVAPERIYDRTRFSTAVKIAEEGFPGWEDVTDVVIASGDDRAAADPLAASGLCWAYEAPLLLVSATHTPGEVKTAIAQIVAENGPVTLRVVGGPVSVPDARLDDIEAHVGVGNVTFDRIRRTGSRFDLAYSIAMRMRSVRGAEMPSVALIANGADATKFFDALALSPISAHNGAPILLVAYDSVPTPTTAALATLAPDTRIVGGGPMTVSESVRAQLGAERWWGHTRYDTAIDIADNAVARGWLSREAVGVAAVIPDALTGGAFMGRKGGVLVITDGTTLTPVTGDWFTTHKTEIEECYVLGGPNSVSPGVMAAIGDALE